MIKAVVFDLDDTLVPEEDYILEGFETVAIKINEDFNINKDEVLIKLKQLFQISPKNVFNRLLNMFDIEHSDKYIKNLVKVYREHKTRVKFYEDIMPVLKNLKSMNIKLGIITDGYKETQIRKIASLECNELFDSIIITDELGREYWKPHKLPYFKASDELGTSFDEMIFVADNILKDFVTANELGIRTVQIIRSNGVYRNIELGEERKSYRPTSIIYSMDNLIRYLY